MKQEEFIVSLNHGKDTGKISDGYHTFDELYEHRFTLYIALCKADMALDRQCGWKSRVWRSKIQSDGTMYEGWFLLGIGKDLGKQITYHLPLSKWEAADFAETLAKAPEFDGHTSQDVIKRLSLL